MNPEEEYEEYRAYLLIQMQSFRSQAVSAAEAILRGELSIVEGSQRLAFLGRALDDLLAEQTTEAAKEDPQAEDEEEWPWDRDMQQTCKRQQAWEREHDRNFDVFHAIKRASESMSIPPPAARRYWNKEALQKKDAEIACYEASHQTEVREACTRIIKKFTGV